MGISTNDNLLTFDIPASTLDGFGTVGTSANAKFESSLSRLLVGPQCRYIVGVVVSRFVAAPFPCTDTDIAAKACIMFVLLGERVQVY